ncbi:DUF7269 family protein, partial [Halorussus litoreus]|uniref:DUF7269 family protein n=1 Tax=Halorussus litoreus TaxID=1710536 RepID=UPI00130032FF
MIARLLGRIVEYLRRRRTIAAVGVASLVVALGVVFLPGLFPESVFRPVSRVLGSQVVVGLFAATAALLAAAALRESATRTSGDDRRATDDEQQTDAWFPNRSPERAHYDEVRTAGREVDRALGTDPDDHSADDVAAMRRDARNRVRTIAVDVVADFENCDRATAARLIADGTWTDDRRAAAFLAGVDRAPLGVRIRDWASGERFERWASRAVAEIEARAGGGGRVAPA